MTAKKATAAELRDVLLLEAAMDVDESDMKWFARQCDDIIAAARAEAVAPVMDVLRMFRDSVPKCVPVQGCGRPATTISTGTRLERFLRCDEHSGHPYPFAADLPYAAGTVVLVCNDGVWRLMKRGVYVDFRTLAKEPNADAAKAAADAHLLAAGWYLAEATKPETPGDDGR